MTPQPEPMLFMCAPISPESVVSIYIDGPLPDAEDVELIMQYLSIYQRALRGVRKLEMEAAEMGATYKPEEDYLAEQERTL